MRANLLRGPGIRRFAAFVLLYNLGVILWGAVVRATVSGDGCGANWPTCNGEILPSLSDRATQIEFLHRATSGPALLFVLVLAIWAWRRYPPGHRMRWASLATFVFIVIEALIGAGLVLLEYVADDTRLARGWWSGGHLVNTFLLLAGLVMTWRWSSLEPSARPAPWAWPRGRRLGSIVLLALALLLVGATGAITALGDTLFPVESLAEGLRQDLRPSAHLFLRLRIWHPVSAVIVGLWAAAFGAWVWSRKGAPDSMRRSAAWLIALVCLQLIVGVVNLGLLAPIPMQLLHLLMADLLWMAFVLTTFELVATPAAAIAD